MNSEKQATPDAELFRRLSSPSEPKTELEHFAWRLYWQCAEDNTKQQAEIKRLKQELENCQSQTFTAPQRMAEDAERWRLFCDTHDYHHKYDAYGVDWLEVFRLIIDAKEAQ